MALSAATVRDWSRRGAPILEPNKMPPWLQERDSEARRKVGAANARHGDKEEEIVRLYVQSRMGLRTLSKYFNGRPSIAGVRRILLRHNVYRPDIVLDDQTARCEARRAEILLREKTARHRMAICLWNLRKGLGVETTCRREGWNVKSIWNDLGRRKSYRAFALRRKRKWPDKRAVGKHYSRKYLTESTFQDTIEGILQSLRLQYIRECKLVDCRTRVDFKLADNSFIECKVAVNSGQTQKFIGQAVHYKEFTERIILCVPADVQMRSDLNALVTKLGVIVCTEFTLTQCLSSDSVPPLPVAVSPPRKSSFVCKCCGSAERRRHRMNSYCVDCAPLIGRMKFDQRVDRWVAG